MGNLILFGAGASFGSLEVHPHCPPLGKDLFNKLDLLKGVAHRLPEDLKEIFRSDFEIGMAELYNRSEGNVMSFQRELAGYLAQFRTKDGNLYLELLKKINIDNFVFSSLNYDLLLEIASGAIGKGVTYSNAFYENHIRVLKIHGSSNFWPDLGGIQVIDGVFRPGDGNGGLNAATIISSPTKVLNYQDTIDRCRNDTTFSPSMAMFAHGKPVSVNPKLIKEQYDMWLTELNKASKVFIIGVRVHEVDEHIWGRIGEVDSEVFYFGFPSDRIEFDQWLVKLKNKNKHFIESDFNSAVEFIQKNQ